MKRMVNQIEIRKIPLLIITLGLLPTVGLASSLAILAAITGGLTLLCILLFLLFFFFGNESFPIRKKYGEQGCKLI